MATKKPAKRSSPKKPAPPKPPAAKKPAAPRKKKAAKPDENREVSGEFERLCPVPIDSVLSKKKYDRIVEALGEVHDKKAELADIARERRAAIKEIEEEIEVLRKQIGDGTEDRLVRCISEKDFRANKVRVIRTDTRQVVEEREMTADDRQETMPGVNKTPAVPPAEEVGPEGEEPAPEAENDDLELDDE